MDFHDAYARTTPLELAFPDADSARASMDRIADEAEARGADTGELGAFAMLVSVNSVMRQLGGAGASQDAILQHVALLYHAYHALGAGAPVHLVTTAAARHLVDDGAWSPAAPPGAALAVDGSAAPDPYSPPARSGYVQLPRHLFWVHADPSAPAEAVDGFFWTSSTSGVVHLLLAVGMREGRPGLTVVPLPEAPLEDAGTWATTPCREGGADFANTLPGGEMEGLLSFVTSGEVFKLAARLFSHMLRTPEAVVSQAVVPGSGGAEGSILPSRLPFVRVVPGSPEGAGA